MGRDADTEKARVIGTVREYLARAAENPSLPLSYDGIQQHTGVSRGHFAKTDDPDYASLVTSILDSRERRSRAAVGDSSASHTGSSTPSSNGAGGGLIVDAALTDEDLEKRVRFQTKEIDRIMRTWLGHHASLGAPGDANLALSDLDAAMGTLRKEAAVLRGLLAELNRRADTALGADRSAAPPAQGSLLGEIAT
jgi:hypothetical protein